ncbi:MAG: apolipoprotein N-acyltransferase [Acidimicrobium sp.]|nr:MAG: apolipoprotein N-acyltransferase [Acidimicrobium sp.]
MTINLTLFKTSSRARKVTALTSGLLVGFSLPPWGWWPLAIIGVTIFFALCNLSLRTHEVFALGTMFAIAWLSLGMMWMWWLTAPGYIFVIVLFSVLHGVAAVVANKFGNTPVTRPIAHTLAEVLRFSLPFGGVPLATLPIAISQTTFADLVSIGGPILTTWFVLQLGALFAAYFNRRESRAKVFRIAITLIVLQIFAIALPSSKPTGETLRIAIVQGGGPQGVLAINASAREAFDRHLKVTKTLQPSDELDAVLWPENVIDVADFKTSKEFIEIVTEASRLDAEFIVGITEDAGPNRFTNAQVVVQPTGEITSRYDKVRRVPFGEYVPAGLRSVLSAIGAPMNRIPNDAVAGKESAMIQIGTTKAAVVISWEAFFAGRANSGVEAGGEVLLNPTNGSSYTGTVLQTQQLATNSLRARETSRWTLQAATTGFSAVISPQGELTSRLGIGAAQTLIVDVPLHSGRTLYSRIGDAPLIIVLLITLISVRSINKRSKIKI